MQTLQQTRKSTYTVSPPQKIYKQPHIQINQIQKKQVFDCCEEENLEIEENYE
jgi:hypothetical protein